MESDKDKKIEMLEDEIKKLKKIIRTMHHVSKAALIIFCDNEENDEE